MKPRDTHIVEPHNLISERLSGKRRFLGDGLVARAAGCNDDFSAPGRLRHRARNTDAPELIIGKRQLRREKVCRLFGKPCDQDSLLPVMEHRLCDFENLLRRFARTVDDLGSALPQRAVMIELCKAQILKGSFLEL